MPKESDAAIAFRLLSDPTVVSYIGMIDPPRPGVREFFAKLEYTHFPPGTPESTAFRLAVVSFRGILFTVAFIPAVRSRAADEIADWIGLRPTSTVPVIIEKGELKKFPLANERSRVLEDRPGHDAYKNDPALLQKLLLEESARVDAIIAAHDAETSPKH